MISTNATTVDGLTGAALPPELLRRIELTAAVRDADRIPKVDGAGTVVERHGHRVQVMHNGVVVKEGGYYGGWMTELIRRLRGHHEPQEEAVFHEIAGRIAADPGASAPAMIEFGSYWAYYSLWLRRTLPGVHAVMVEPDPRNLDVGRLNFWLNGEDGEFLRAAVGDRHGATEWFRCESDDRFRLTRHVTIDGLMHELGMARAEVVLCDTQGAELALLESGREALATGRVRFLVVSTHHHSITGDPLTHQRCLASLREIGAHVIAEHTIAESCSGDGLIAVSMDQRDAGWEVPVTRVRARDSLFGELEHDLAVALGAPPL